MKNLQFKKILISGPCSAESYEQTMKTAISLQKMGVNFFRAGIWKPRTRPNEFEGVGEIGLQWLKEVKKETGIDVITEVATPKHVELCEKYNITSVWIGARTTSNPFSISELSKAIKGSSIVNIGIKNPISSDINLWIGAIERICKSNVPSIFAIHRGFYSNIGKYRNDPNWTIPIKLKRTFPNMKILCDPSHICGNVNLISQVSQMAMNLMFDGLMIECHIDPKQALTDKNQQLTPNELETLLQQLEFKKSTSNHPMYIEKINVLRQKIDYFDYQLIDLLEARMNVAYEIGKEKEKEKVSILQPNRWSELINNRLEYSKKGKLSDDFILSIFENIHVESIKHQ